MELSSSNTKKFLTFSRKKAFIIFQETETLQKFLIFHEKELFYITGIFQKVTFRARKMTKKTHSKEMSYISGNESF